MRSKLIPGVAAVAVLLLATQASAHCQIPCGIYNDELRVELMKEDAETIAKSMKMINELSGAKQVDYNQLVRWVVNKEEHAVKLQDIVTEYFMAQRIKVPATTSGEEYATYQLRLELLHKILVAAMKAKQTSDLAAVEPLRAAIDAFAKEYFGQQ